MFLTQKIIPLKFTFFILLLTLFSCNNRKAIKENTENAILNSKQSGNENILKERLLIGDTLAYFELRQLYISSDNLTDFLPWAMIMANKYSFETAYYDVFFCIQEVNRQYGTYLPDTKTYTNLLDSATNEFSIYYLNKLSNKYLVNKTLEHYFNILPK